MQDLMAHPDPTKTLHDGFQVGEYFIEPDAQRVRTRDGSVRVEPKVMDVLVRLAQQPGKTVTHEEFMDDVWSDTVVTTDALLRCISELRKLFGDDPQHPAYVETIRKRGYRLIAPVKFPDAKPSTVPASPEPWQTTDARQPNRATAPPTTRRFRTTLRLGAAGMLVLAAVVGVLMLRKYAPEVPAPLRAVPLTTLLGVESDPNLAPDGSQVAFVWDKGDGGNFDIFVKQIGMETPLRLTNSPSDDRSPTWSPDGRSIAYVRNGGSERGLYVVSALGGAPRRVANFGQQTIHAVAWSPDGETLAFTAAAGPDGPFGIRLLSLATLETRQLTQPPANYRGDAELAFSPDGRLVAFVRSIVERVDDIYLVGVSGSEVKRLTFDHAEITGLDWSSDGGSIVFSSDREGASTLWRVPVSGRTPGWIPTAIRGSGVHQPSVARSGDLLAFVQRVQHVNIWSYPVPAADDDSRDDRDAPRPVITSTQWDSNPSVSPDGRHIAYVSNRTGSYEVWMSDADGDNPVQMTSFGGPFTSTPRWSPDGNRIAFAGRGKDNVDIYILEVTGGRVERLTSANANDQAPHWSRDGEWIYFGSNRTGRWQVWKIPASGGDAVQVTQEGGYAASEGPSGDTIYLVKRDEPGIWQLHVESGSEIKITGALESFDWGNWAVGSDALYFARREPAGTRIVRYDLDTGAHEDVLTLDALPRHPALALFPDGGRILVSRTDRVEGDIYLVENFR